jgi:hypothetical protein
MTGPSKPRLTQGSTGAAQASLLLLIECYVRGPVIPTVRRLLVASRFMESEDTL